MSVAGVSGSATTSFAQPQQKPVQANPTGQTAKPQHHHQGGAAVPPQTFRVRARHNIHLRHAGDTEHDRLTSPVEPRRSCRRRRRRK